MLILDEILDKGKIAIKYIIGNWCNWNSNWWVDNSVRSMLSFLNLMIILWLILSFLRRKENSTITTTSINSNSNTYWGINMWYKLFWALLLINPVNPQNNAVRWVLLSPGFYKWGNQHLMRKYSAPTLTASKQKVRI